MGQISPFLRKVQGGYAHWCPGWQDIAAPASPSMRKTNQAGINLIKYFETFSPVPYICPAGYWTIGWGHLCARDNPPITEERGEQLLEGDIFAAELAVSRMVKVRLTDNQYAALVSFTFNLGGGRLASSTLLRRLNAGYYVGAADQFGKWVFGGGRKLPGLVTRRAAERQLFLT